MDTRSPPLSDVTVSRGAVTTAAKKRGRPCWNNGGLQTVSTVFALTVSAVERRAGFGPRRRLRPAAGPDPEVVVRVGAQVKGQVAAGFRRPLTVVGVDPAAVQNHQLELPEKPAERSRNPRWRLVWRLLMTSSGRDSPLELNAVEDCSAAVVLQGAPPEHVPHVHRVHVKVAGGGRRPNACGHGWFSRFQNIQTFPFLKTHLPKM